MLQVGETGSPSNRESCAPVGQKRVSGSALAVQETLNHDARISAHKWRYCFCGTARFAGRWRKASKHHFGEAIHMKYEKPAVQRFGTVREITLGSGPNQPGDATNLYHRS